MSRVAPLYLIGFSLIILGMVHVDAATPVLRVGYVDLQRTLDQTAVGKSARKKFETKKKKKQETLDKQQADLQQQAAALKKQSMVLKPDSLAQKQRALEEQYMQLQQTYVQLERELAEEQNSLIRKILEKATPQIQDIAREQGFSLILDRGSVLWADDSVDITDQLNKRMK